MKRIVASVLLAAIMLLNVIAMASCGPKETPDIDGMKQEIAKAGWQVPAEGYDGSAVTITFWHTMSQTKLQPTLELYIQEFNKLYPNITVDHSSPGSYDDVLDQVKTSLTAGNEPNIAYCYPDHVASYLNAMKVVPLDNLINSQIPVTDAQGNTTILGLTEEQKADFVPGYYAEGAVFDQAGTMYTLPMSKSTEALYYNKTFFEDNNLTVPTTWDEMEAVCAAIKAIDPDCIPLGYDSEANWFITMCMQYGGADLYTKLDANKDYFKFDNPTTREFVERFKRWYDLGYFTTEELYGSYTSGLFTNTTANNDNGTPDDPSDDITQRCYMVIGSTGGASYQTPPTNNEGFSIFETAMTTIPQVDPAKPQVISQGPSLCIFKKANPQEVVASWLFVEFLTTNADFQAEFSKISGYAPVIQSVQNNEDYANWLNSAKGEVTQAVDENGQPVFVDGEPVLIDANLTAMSVKLALSQANAYYVSPAFNGSSEARKQVGLIMVNVFGSTRTDIKALIEEEFSRAMGECKYAVNN